MSCHHFTGTRLLRLIRASFIASQGIYGAPRVFLDLREAGETCGTHRVVRLMADYIDTFYNRSSRHSHLGGVSPEQFEAAHKSRGKGVH